MKKREEPRGAYVRTVQERTQRYVSDLLKENERLRALLGSFGVDRARFESVRFGSGIIGQVAATGERYIASGERVDVDADGPADESNLTVCIPLKLAGEIVGAIAIFRLLPQKMELEAGDHELIELLATHAATALAFTELYARRRAGKRP